MSHSANNSFLLSTSHRGSFRLAPTAALLALCGGMSFGQQPAAAPISHAAIATEYGKLPLSFTPNQGQNDPRVKFSSRGAGYSLFLTDSAAVLALNKVDAQPKKGAAAMKMGPAASATAAKNDVVRMELAGVLHNLRVSGAEQLPGKVNYFIGNDPQKWHSDIPTYGKVKYSAVYPGVDLVYYGNQRQLEYDFIVAPGANANPVRLHFAGASKLALNCDGDLTVAAKHGAIAFRKPLTYQMKDGKRELVEGRFKLLGKNDLGFALGDYDHARELIIDPTLVYSTYLGGNSSEQVNGIAVDANGHAFVAGRTSSMDFPTTGGSYKPSSLSSFSAFVTEFDTDGSGLIYSTYLGGSNSDGANAISLGADGHAFVTGYADSNDFPVTMDAYETTPSATSNYNGFVTELNETGSHLIYSTFLNEVVSPTGIAVDSSGHAYVTGWTRTTDLPVSPEAYQKTNHARGQATINAFVIKLEPAGNGAVYSTYLGGSGNDLASAIAVDKTDHAYVTGAAYSVDFPHTEGAYQSTNLGKALQVSNAFVTKFNEAGSALSYSTYLGGSGGASGGDSGNGIAVDGTGDSYVAGTANSCNFPVTAGAFQINNDSCGGSNVSLASNAIIAKLNPSGTALLYSTYLGGSGQTNQTQNVSPVAGFGDSANAIAVDSLGDALVTGYAVSTNFPATSDAYQKEGLSQGDNFDGDNQMAFFTKLNPAGSKLLYSTYLSGDGCGFGMNATQDGIGDVGNAIAVD